MKAQQVNRVLISGSVFSTLGEVIQAVANLVTSIVGARLLPVHDFGLMATVILTLSILEHFSQTGFDSALVQRQSDVEPYLDVAWTWHLLRGVIITAVVAGLAYPLGGFYGESELPLLMLACCFSALLQGAHNVGPIFFSRQLDFKTLFLTRLAHIVVKLAIFLPAIIIFRNVWALVVGHLAGATVGLVISYVVHPYRPRIAFDRAKLKELIGYGKWLTGMAWIGFVITRGDDLFVSKYVGVAALALYELAYKISNTPTTNITHVIGRIGLPTYARLRGDREELRATFLKVMRVTLLLSFPVTVFIYLGVPDFVTFVIGSKWQAIVPLVRILALSGFVRSIAALAGPVFQATGRPDLDFKMNLPRFFCTVGLIWPFTAKWGLEGACWVVLIAITTCMPTWIVGLRMLLQLKLGEVLRTNGLALVTGLMLTGCMLLAAQVAPGGWVGALVRTGGALLLWVLLDLVAGFFTKKGVAFEVKRLLDSIRQSRIDAAARAEAAEAA